MDKAFRGGHLQTFPREAKGTLLDVCRGYGPHVAPRPPGVLPELPGCQRVRLTENAAGRGRQADYRFGGMKRPTFRTRAEADELFLGFGPPETYDQQAFGAIECDLVPGKRLVGLGSKS